MKNMSAPAILITFFSISGSANDFSLKDEDMQLAMQAVGHEYQTEAASPACGCLSVEETLLEAKWDRLNDFKDVERSLRRITKGKVLLSENVELHWKIRSTSKANISLVIPIKSN
jgi:hypothetical protein